MGNTDESLRVVSFKLPAALDRQLSSMAARRRSSRSAVMREAIQALARSDRGSVAEAAAKYIGSVKSGPSDLSSNPEYLADLGK